MAFLFIILAVVVAFLARGQAEWPYALANAIAAFWSNGVLLNYKPWEAKEAPNWAATVSFLTLLVSLVIGAILIF